MSTSQMTTVFPQLKGLSVLQHNIDCPLDAYELLIYSYLAHKDRHKDQFPSNRQIAGATGICEETVARNIQQLAEHSCLREGKFVQQKSFFNIKEDKQHVAQAFFWRYLVPRVGSPVTVNMSIVLSYVLHRTINGKPPNGGWKYAYLAKVLRIDQRTVSSAWEQLTELGFIVPEGIYTNISPAREAYFQLAGERTSGASTGMVLQPLVENFVTETAVVSNAYKPVQYIPQAMDITDWLKKNHGFGHHSGGDATVRLLRKLNLPYINDGSWPENIKDMCLPHIEEMRAK